MWVALAAFGLLWAAKWPSFPLILDPSYHLLIARQVLEAGGPIAYEWWEAAPEGRPHLYPPVLHLLLAALTRLTGDLLSAIRLLSVALPILFLASLAATVKRLAGQGLAAACLLVALMPYAFHLQSAITLAGTLGLIELLWLITAAREGRPAAAGALWVLLWYTHLTLPWVAALALACEAAWQPRLRRALLRAVAWLVLALPWWWHLWVHRQNLRVTSRYENQLVELYPVLLALAALGLWMAWKRRAALSWVLGTGIGLLLFAPHHTYRWMNGEGMLGWAVLAGVGLHALVARAAKRSGRHATIIGAALIMAVLMGPTLAHRPAGWTWRWPDTAPWHLLTGKGEAKSTDAGYDTAPVREVLALIRQRTQPGDILWSNSPHACGLIAALAGRAMSGAMLEEVRPQAAFDPIRAAHAIVWFKIDPSPGEVTQAALPAGELELIHETDIATLWRHPPTARGAHPPVAVLPLAAAWLALAGLAGIAMWQLGRARQASRFAV